MIKKHKELGGVFLSKALCFYKLLSTFQEWLPRQPPKPMELVDAEIHIGEHAAIGGISSLVTGLVGKHGSDISFIDATTNSNSKILLEHMNVLNSKGVKDGLRFLDVDSTTKMMSRCEAQAAGDEHTEMEEVYFEKDVEAYLRQHSSSDGGYLYWISDTNAIKLLDPKPCVPTDKALANIGTRISSISTFMLNQVKNNVIGVSDNANAMWNDDYFQGKGKKVLLQAEKDFYSNRVTIDKCKNAFMSRVYEAPKWSWLIPLSEEAKSYFTEEQRQRREEYDAARLRDCEKLRDFVLNNRKENGIDGEEIILRHGREEVQVNIDNIDWTKIAQSKGSNGYTKNELKSIVEQVIGNDIKGFQNANKDILRECLVEFHENFKGPIVETEAQHLIRKIKALLKAKAKPKKREHCDVTQFGNEVLSKCPKVQKSGGNKDIGKKESSSSSNSSRSSSINGSDSI